MFIPLICSGNLISKSFESPAASVILPLKVVLKAEVYFVIVSPSTVTSSFVKVYSKGSLASAIIEKSEFLVNNGFALKFSEWGG